MQRIDLLFANLNDEEKFILIQRYGLDGSEPKTLREIAENDGRSKQRISQIQEAALKKLKFWYGEEPMQMTA
ncbi:MAG: sigma factor-like helix-turn-helix DNA-binding protein [bacterium]